jgi:hypothetical protein
MRIGVRIGSFLTILAAVFAATLIFPRKSEAIPAFARQYQTSCSTCHSDFPKLNDFGKAFKDAGFKFPTDDETFIKEPPVMLGAPAQKKLWPHTVWPGTMPGSIPLGFRYNTFFQVTGRNANRLNSALTAFNNGGSGFVPESFVPRTDFQTGLLSIFTAGNFGSGIAFWVDEDLSVAGSGADGGLGDGYLKFVDIGRFLKLPKDSLSLRIGQFELDLPFSQARSYNLSGWDIYEQANVGAMNALFPQQFVNNAVAFSEPSRGVELSGGHSYGGYHYSVAIVNQNTSGVTDPGTFAPAASAFFSDSNFKDFYGRFSYRFNLERDRESRNAVQAAGPSGPRDHSYLTFGTFYFYGRSVQRVSGLVPITLAPTVLTAREPFYRAGGDFNFNYRTFNLYGVFMHGRDQNLLPNGIPPTGFIQGVPATFSGGFLQADYMPLPWIMTIMRYDAVNSQADRINGLLAFGPARATRNRFTPGVQFLVRANIKALFEYQIRPDQIVVDPLTGLPGKPTRVNTAVFGLDFVY